MASLNRTNFKSSKDAAFPDNTSGLITEVAMRTQFDNIADSHFNLMTDGHTGAKGTKPGVNDITTLKAVATVSIAVGAYVSFRDTGNFDALRVYELVSSTAAESSPDFIRPDDYASTTNEKVWRLSKILPRYSLPGITTITGLKDIITAGVSGLGVGTYVSFADSDASDVLRTYKLTAGTTAESSPNVIRPDDYAGGTNEKVWILMTHAIIGGTP